MGALAPLAASGGPACITLVELATFGGKNYFWSEHRASWPSLLLGGGNVSFLDYLSGQQKFSLFGSTQTDTAAITVQNISGNTMQRDVMLAFTTDELIGALFAARVWHGAAEKALFTFIGNVIEAEPNEDLMTLQVEGLGNWSAINAPDYDIDKSCPLTFASVACGSTAPTPCDQSYGGCSQINRFAGAVSQWDFETPNIQIAQPPPAAFFNRARVF